MISNMAKRAVFSSLFSKENVAKVEVTFEKI